jgi:septal ring factor EnvC (AmiA/AmiB activator)
VTSPSPGPRPDPVPTAVPPAPTPLDPPVPANEQEAAQLRAELQNLRSDVGDTVAELTERADVPARLKARTHEITDQTRQLVAEKTPVITETVRSRPLPSAAAVAALVFVVITLIRRRRSKQV